MGPRATLRSPITISLATAPPHLPLAILSRQVPSKRRNPLFIWLDALDFRRAGGIELRGVAGLAE